MEKSIVGEINRLRCMTVGELQAEWMRLYNEPSRSRNKHFLFRRLAWRIQELAHGGLSQNARTRIDELASDGFRRARTPITPTTGAEAAPEAKSARVRDIRMPTPGTVISRRYKGREYQLVVRDDHFELDDQAFKSLSEAARHVTGSRWNGWLFWGLTERKRRS
jgi:hypothetical protein